MVKKQVVLMVSTKFPAYHIRKGQETNFPYKIKKGTKIHTLRGNYENWYQRIKQINLGFKYLSVRIWTGMPYRSKQKEIARFEKVGIQKCVLTAHDVHIFDAEGKIPSKSLLAKNDGLTNPDFESWFDLENINPLKEFAIIHFTDFRY